MRILPQGRQLAAVLLVFTLIAASCGDSDPVTSGTSGVTTPETGGPTTSPDQTSPDQTSPDQTSTPPSSTSATTAGPTTAAPTTAPPTTAAPTTAAPTTAPPTTDLPGEEHEFGPREGDQIAVMGVRHDDVLNVREAPGVDRDIITTLAPTASGIVAEGHTRFLPNSVWYQVTANGVTGWASAAFLAFLGDVDDATAEIVSDLGGIPTEDTLLELGETIASTMVSVEPASRVTVTVAPTVGDLAEVTIDIVGLGDDALAGFRLHIFAQPDGARWALKTVERTILCTRGLSGGLCA